MATRYDFTIKQGSDVDFTIQVYSDSSLSVPMDLTGWDARMMIRASRRSTGSPLVSLTSNPAAGLTVNGIAGQISIHIDGDDTSAYTWFNGQWDLEAFNGSSIKEAAYGNVSIRAEVTHP